MRRTAQYVAFVALLLGVALWTQVSRPKQFVWLPTYAHHDTQPLGCAVFDSVMAFTLPRGYEVTRKPLIQIAREDSASVRNVLVVDEDIVLWPGELDALFRMTKRGAKVMLVANRFDNDLQDTLGIHTAMQGFTEIASEEIELATPCDTLVWADGAGGYAERRFPVRSDFVAEGLYLADTCAARVLARQHVWQPDDTTRVMPVAVSIPLGKGELILVQTPRLFTNYGILHPRHRDFVLRLLDRLKDAPVVRSLFYCDFYTEYGPDAWPSDARGPFDYILSQPPLRWAFHVALATIVLLMCFTARRRQRPIPPAEPLPNRNLEFVKLIGTLYFRHETPAELMRKKWLYFADEVQRRTGRDLRACADPDEQAALLAEAAGMDAERLLPLMRRMHAILFTDTLSIGTDEMKRLTDRLNDVARRL